MFTWRRGATFQMGLRVSGTLPDGATALCQMKPALPDNTSPGDDVSATLSLTATATSDGWLFEGTSAQGAALKVGRYVADARVQAGGKTYMTDPVIIEVLERVSS